ncbi:MAG: hypothetical protein EON92_12390 [Burkholderiales bacterium]|nr:MAG: hypothetical protein EON92_12390 [Burkholderiales bacterium]
MQGKLALAIIFIALCARVASTQAQNIYKCGSTYSQQPCAGGSVVEPANTPAPSQKAQTDAATRRDAKTAAAMEKARLKAEAQPVAVHIPPPRSEATTAGKPAAKLKKPEAFIATVPRQPGEQPPRKKKPKKKQDA